MRPLRVPGPAVPLELVDADIVLGDRGGERDGVRVVGGALRCQLLSQAASAAVYRSTAWA